ncbi:hypothetical protein TUM4261_25460 [Shewanella sp. c952]|uniref:DegT/DnrJ/EryC1/StrS family aminotransferase n=1 Tax=Shewanella sp. c952 TaxID=2815913 RepID=UPI001BC1FC7E|nr:DegT/DnrJ/EryC1/StrS family aminotransferase [Shewanella sp. c952]GIU12382.1 hypothetical protein TUM4261_25460 [Shewanella sp. c952]
MKNEKYILNPDFFMIPSYRISPFSTRDIKFNADIPKSKDELDTKILEKHGVGWNFLMTSGGRSAINVALTDLALEHDDIITILTPSNNNYVSGCVTKEIETFCKWNRVVNKETKAIFIVHEFGKLYENIDELSVYNLPIIEDYAHSFDSYDKRTVKGDYLIYSLPKFFPIQYGGFVLSKNKLPKAHDILNENSNQYLRTVLNYYWDYIGEFSSLRKRNFKRLAELFSNVGFFPRFNYSENETPSVFMFKNNECEELKLDLLKNEMQAMGIESSIFYGEQSFFIPVNHTLDYVDMQYIYDVFVNIKVNNEAC